MAFVGSLEDRLLIRERYGAYSDACFRQDQAAWLACWTEDCVWRPVGLEFRGAAGLKAGWEQIWAPVDKLAFFSEVGAIEVDGDRATARCYCREILQLQDGGLRKLVGAYEDVLARVNGAWLFVERTYQLLMSEGGGALI